MIKLRPAGERGGRDHGWLNTRHTFSFADYHDPNQMGFRVLRVMNEDRVAPGRGFAPHGHRDMEIVSYVLTGALEHKDSLGRGAVLRPGEVQRISAGTGIEHSEFNGSAVEPVHFYQIWLLPDRPGHSPNYEQKAFSPEGRQCRWQAIVTPDGRDGSISIHQDAKILLADLQAGGEVTYPFDSGRYGWLQVLNGEVALGATTLQAGDGAALWDESGVALQSPSRAEVMLFDLP